VADEPESQEACFAPHGYRAALAARGVPASEGAVIDAAGTVLGWHRGQWQYTIGQRRGLGVSGEEPLYVLERRAQTNEVVVGPRDALRTTSVLVRELEDRGLGGTRALSVRLRYRSAAVRVAGIEWTATDSVRLTLAEPFEGVAPGQSAVFYDNEVMVGGGVISGQGTCDSLRRVPIPREPPAIQSGGDSWMR
jgi:tRNA-specific 2-thiouridylase